MKCMHHTHTENPEKIAETPKRDVVEQSHKNPVENKITQPLKQKQTIQVLRQQDQYVQGLKRVIIRPAQYKDYV